jgi:hypothetical protein
MACPFIASSAGMEQTAISTVLVPPPGHRPRDRNQLIELQRQLGAAGSYHCKVVNQRWPVLDDHRILRRQEVDDDVDRWSTIDGLDPSHKLEAPELLPLLIPGAHQ